MPFLTKPITMKDFKFKTLKNQVAYLPGCKDKRNAPIIFIQTDKALWEDVQVKTEDLTSLLLHYYDIVR